MEKFVGKYKLVKSEMFEEYLRAKGNFYEISFDSAQHHLSAGFLAVKMATALNPYMEISVEGDVWKLKVYTAIKTVTDMTFKLGEEFYHTRMDGTKCKVVMRVEDNKLIEEEAPVDHPEESQTNVREWVDDDHVVLTLKCKDVVAKRHFERIKPST